MIHLWKELASLRRSWLQSVHLRRRFYLTGHNTHSHPLYMITLCLEFSLMYDRHFSRKYLNFVQNSGKMRTGEKDLPNKQE